MGHGPCEPKLHARAATRVWLVVPLHQSEGCLSWAGGDLLAKAFVCWAGTAHSAGLLRWVCWACAPPSARGSCQMQRHPAEWHAE